jgi:hypothetical protein
MGKDASKRLIFGRRTLEFKLTLFYNQNEPNLNLGFLTFY